MSSAPVARSRIAYYSTDDWISATDLGRDDGRYDQLHRPTGTVGGAWATDADGDPITYTVEEVPEFGSVTLDATTGSYIYTPAADFTGYDQFTYTASDAISQSAPATVLINGFGTWNNARKNAWTNTWGLIYELAAVRFTNGSMGAQWIVPGWGTGLASKSLSIEILTQPSQGSVYHDIPSDTIQFHPDLDFEDSDEFTFVIHNGALTSKPITAHYTLFESTSQTWDQYWTNSILDNSYGVEANFATPVNPELPTYIDHLDTDENGWLHNPRWSYGVVTQPEHGIVTFSSDGTTYTYYPSFDAASGGDPYIGADAFGVIGYNNGVATPEQWISLEVTYDATPTPPPALPEAWVPIPFNGTFTDLQAKVVAVRGLQLNLLARQAELGQLLKQIDDAGVVTEEDVEPYVLAVSNLYDAIEAAYQNYLTGLIDLQGNLASHHQTWESTWKLFSDGWTHAQELETLMAEVAYLTPAFAGLSPNYDFYVKFSQALQAHGDAMALNTTFYNTAEPTARYSHKVVEYGEYAAGLLSGGTYTVASLTTKAGLAVLIKTVARNAAIYHGTQVALTPVMTTAVAAATKAGMSPNAIAAGMAVMSAAATIHGLKGKAVGVPRGAHSAADSVHVALKSRGRATQHLRDELGLVKGDGLEAHHLIPVDAAKDTIAGGVVSMAARGGFHFNGKANGRPMPNQHGWAKDSPIHKKYNADVIDRIKDLHQQKKFKDDLTAAIEIEKLTLEFDAKISNGDYWPLPLP